MGRKAHYMGVGCCSVLYRLRVFFACSRLHYIYEAIVYRVQRISALGGFMLFMLLRVRLKRAFHLLIDI